MHYLLHKLIRFVSGIEIGKTSQYVISSHNGRVIAGSTSMMGDLQQADTGYYVFCEWVYAMFEMYVHHAVACI